MSICRRPSPSSGGQTAQFTGAEHALHYDIVYSHQQEGIAHAVFRVLGGGMKLFRGTGAPEAYQALSQIGYFTKTQAIKPMVSVGGGLTFQLAPRYICGRRSAISLRRFRQRSLRRRLDEVRQPAERYSAAGRNYLSLID